VVFAAARCCEVERLVEVGRIEVVLERGLVLVRNAALALVVAAAVYMHSNVVHVAALASFDADHLAERRRRRVDDCVGMLRQKHAWLVMAEASS